MRDFVDGKHNFRKFKWFSLQQIRLNFLFQERVAYFK